MSLGRDSRPPACRSNLRPLGDRGDRFACPTVGCHRIHGGTDLITAERATRHRDDDRGRWAELRCDPAKAR